MIQVGSLVNMFKQNIARILQKEVNIDLVEARVDHCLVDWVTIQETPDRIHQQEQIVWGDELVH